MILNDKPCTLVEEARFNSHCRICGSFELDKYHYISDFSTKVELYQQLQEKGSLDELIRPCDCRGEFAHAHRICLANWIETTKHEYCDICRFKYNISYINKSFFDWLVSCPTFNSILKTFFLGVAICYSISFIILINQGQFFQIALNFFGKSTTYVILIAIALCSIAYQVRMIRDFLEWRITHKWVFIQPNPNPQLDIQPRPKDILRTSGFNPKYTNRKKDD